MSAARIVANAFFPSQVSAQTSILKISAPYIVNAGSDDDLDDLALHTGSVIRECGSETFELDMTSHSYVYEVPISSANEAAIDCIIKRFGGLDDFGGVTDYFALTEDHVTLRVEVGNE